MYVYYTYAKNESFKQTKNKEKKLSTETSFFLFFDFSIVL